MIFLSRELPPSLDSHVAFTKKTLITCLICAHSIHYSYFGISLFSTEKSSEKIDVLTMVILLCSMSKVSCVAEKQSSVKYTYCETMYLVAWTFYGENKGIYQYVD